MTMYVKAHNNLARVLEAQGNIPEAIEQYLQTLAIDPNNAIAKRHLDRLLP